ncbi:hypothetical protein JCM6882_005053 [Rhodosporidiobolus microsporus]
MDLPPTPLRLSASLPYPLTVQRIHAPPGTQIRKTQALLTYSFVPQKPDDDGRRDRQVRVWESPIEGEVVSWAAREGDVIPNHRNAIVKIKEPCTHDVQLHGLCALCGKDLNAVDYTGFSDTSRATISMVHDVGGLTVSLDEAHRLESATTTRLLSARKLSLIVDLDQTIVHATVDPTVGEWLQDPKNPNYKALEGVGKFKLVDEVPAKKKRKTTRPPEGAEKEEESEDEENGCWYYIKMRPGLPDFLKRIAQIYEMHVYTMGTRAYAKEVCKVIDPDGGLFGGRILSRDESGSMTRKSLQRLFPCDTNMVVIIDDRADVWDGSPNLVKTIPYEFFVGIGDINAAFLPKKKDLVPPPVNAPAPSPAADSPSPSSPTGASSSLSESEETNTTTPPSSPDSPPEEEGKVEEHALPESVVSEPTTVSDLLVDSSPSEIVSPSLSEASTAAALTIHDVIEARPLEKAQREADSHHHHHHPHGKSENGSASPEGAAKTPEGEEANGGEAAVGEGAEEDAEGEEEEYEEEAVLKDDDRELDRLFDILSTVHGRFFEEHKARSTADVASIIPALKRQALRSTHLVFSGLVALGSRPEDSEYWKLATTFGARCSAELSSSVTHLVANQAGTAKVHSARRNPRIKIVYPQWLLESVAHWTRCDESAYLLPTPETTSPPGSPIRPEMSDEDEEQGEAVAGGKDKGKGRAVDANDVEEEGPDTDTLPEGELDLVDVDWGDAMKEVDDLLDETDDEDTASLVGGGNGTDGGESDTGSVGSAPRARKRARMSTPTDDGAAEGNGGGARGKAAGEATESPLQKRVKTARSRKSGLKTSLSAATLEAAGTTEGAALAAVAAAVVERRPSFEEAGFPASLQASQASSSLDSDDDDLLASMAAEVEKGWS